MDDEEIKIDEEKIKKITDWINTLDGEQKEGAIDALNRILSGRNPGKSSPMPPPKDLPIDPELDDPEDDENEPEDDEPEDDEPEIDDPDDVLKDKKDKKDKKADSEPEDEKIDDDDDKEAKKFEKDLEDAEKRKGEVFKRKVEAARMKQILDKISESEEADDKTKEEAAELSEKFQNILDQLNENEDAIDDMSAEEFNDLVNKALEMANKAGVKVTVSKDKQARIKKIHDEMTDEIENDLANDEDSENRQADTEYQKMKASEAEKERLKKELEDSKNRKFDGTLATFEEDLKKAISKQIGDAEEEVIETTWSKEDRHHSDDGIATPGERIDDVKLPNKKRPSVSVYFDQSGSWSKSEVEKGLNAISLLLDLEKAEKLNLDIKYFSKILSSSQAAARDQGSQECWDLVIDDIIAPPKTDNVIIMTDSDIGYDYGYTGHHGCKNGSGATVAGCVWYLWKNGDRVPEARSKLKGIKGTFEYTVS